MNGLHDFPKFVRKVFYDHDVTKMNLNINPTQTTILMVIDENREKSMSQISKLVGLEKSSFTRSVDHLVDLGYMKRQYSKEDRRIIHILFTEKGNKAVKMIRDDWNKYFNSLISDFTAQEKKEFFNAVDTVSKYINRIVE